MAIFSDKIKSNTFIWLIIYDQQYILHLSEEFIFNKNQIKTHKVSILTIYDANMCHRIKSCYVSAGKALLMIEIQRLFIVIVTYAKKISDKIFWNSEIFINEFILELIFE